MIIYLFIEFERWSIYL